MDNDKQKDNSQELPSTNTIYELYALGEIQKREMPEDVITAADIFD